MPECFVTSLSLNRIDRQLHCLNSWRAYGLPIVAVQTIGEIDRLSQHFQGVEFREVEAKENAFNKPHLPRIYDILKAVDFDCILINSDIEIKDPYKVFASEWFQPPAESLVVGVRLDYAPQQKPIETRFGVDAFRVSPCMASALQDDGFVIGMPGWDYWLPWIVWNAGFFGQRAKSILLHRLHAMGWVDSTDGEIARSMLQDRFRMPPHVFTVFVQWLTRRENARRKRT